MALTPEEIDEKSEELVSTFPWIGALGLTIDDVLDLFGEKETAAGVLAQIRQTPGYQQMFAGIRRADGTMRLDEASYLRRKDEYRQVLVNFGQQDAAQNQDTYRALFEQDMEPQQLEQRYEIFQSVSGPAGQQIRDAMFVYGGLDVDDDDLYQAAIDPTYRATLSRMYDDAVAFQTDSEGFYKRAEQRFTQRVLEDLNNIRETVQSPELDQILQTIYQSSPAQRQQVLELIQTSGSPEDATNFLPFESLKLAFQNALIGSTATAQGLELPTAERVEELRLSGINRQQALEGYSNFARQRALLRSAIRRTEGDPMAQFGQNEFEEAVFLQDAAQADRVRAAMEREQSFGQVRTGFLQQQGPGGRIRQPGMARY